MTEVGTGEKSTYFVTFTCAGNQYRGLVVAPNVERAIAVVATEICTREGIPGPVSLMDVEAQVVSDVFREVALHDDQTSPSGILLEVSDITYTMPAALNRVPVYARGDRCFHIIPVFYHVVPDAIGPDGRRHLDAESMVFVGPMSCAYCQRVWADGMDAAAPCTGLWAH